MPAKKTIEETRLDEAQRQTAHWRRWGPYLSERQWGSVREDYSSNGQAWEFFPHEHSRSRAYRWGEDGIAGISDNHQRICFSVAMWNGKDPVLKERLFGLTGPEGNHGEDVKEYYFYLDSTPTHSYMKCLYKYPQTAFPYQQLIEENRKRGQLDPEFELLDSGAFADNRYFDIVVEYAKAAPDDILIKITAVNHGPEASVLHLLPQIWFRNTWEWDKKEKKPGLFQAKSKIVAIEIDHADLGKRVLFCDSSQNRNQSLPPKLLFTENETNLKKVFGIQSGAYAKDGINDYVVNGNTKAVNPAGKGTKAAADYELNIQPGQSAVVRLRLSDTVLDTPFNDFDSILAQRIQDADEFYSRILPDVLDQDLKNVQRQAFAGMLWSKQFYHYVIEDWLKGDPGHPVPPSERKSGRNHDWEHLYNEDILSMPDKWEYPWFASWDLAFHCIPLSMIDPDFAKKQLLLLTREWYMHPNGQIPAYEWNFSDVNPPVHAWAAWRVYKIEKKINGREDRLFLERVFQKLLLNFTWWVNRKDASGKNIFQGGFLGLDNISVFDRSMALPGGGHLDQSDATSWMGMYCLNMLTIALELARHNPSYEDIASKFFEHFLYIAEAMTKIGDRSLSLWNEEDGFFYDVLHLSDGRSFPLKVRSMVGLIPMFAAMTLDTEMLELLPGFEKRMRWFIDNRPDLCSNVASMKTKGMAERRLLSILNADRLKSVLKKMLDEKEFLSPYGIRSVSKFHEKQPYILNVDGSVNRVDYEPAESKTRLFGGNSNWRGPIWFPVNFLIIESLQKFHYYLGDDFKVECPTGSGKMMTLWQVASEISHRMIHIFQKDKTGKRPVYYGNKKFQEDPHWQDLVLFYEYFHGDFGAGLGASHQTGWTGVVAKLIQQCGEYCGHHKAPDVSKKSGVPSLASPK